MKSHLRKITSLSITQLILWVILLLALLGTSHAALTTAASTYGSDGSETEFILAIAMIFIWIIGIFVAIGGRTLNAIICILFSEIVLLCIAGASQPDDLGIILQVIFLPLVFLGGLLLFIARLTFQQQLRSTLLILNDITHLNLAPEMMLDAAARGSSGWQKRSLTQLRDRLQTGETISDALHHALPQLPRTLIATFAAAERIGQLPAALRRACDRINTRRENIDADTFYLLYYSAFLLVMIAFVTFVILVFVIPKFAQLFHDYRIALPWATRLLMRIADPFVSGPLLLILICLAALTLILFSFSPTITWRHSLADGLYAIPGVILIDRLLLHLPLVGGIIRHRGLSDLCSLAADAARHNQPLAETLSQASRAQSNRWLRRRVAHWADRLNRGQPISVAAAAEHFPPLLVGMLAPASDTGDIANVFSFLAQYYEFRLRRARAILSSLLIPIVVLILGSLVCLVALSIIQAITQLNLTTAHIAEVY